jgi:hypothetical protein
MQCEPHRPPRARKAYYRPIYRGAVLLRYISDVLRALDPYL